MSQVRLPGGSSRLRMIASFAAVYIIWGSTYLAIRIAIKTLPPFFLGGIRFTISGAILYSWARLRGVPKPTRFNWRSAAIVGALLLFLGNGSVAWAEQRVPSSITALLMATVPSWTVLLDWIRRGGIRPNPGVVAGVALGFAGVILLVTQGDLVGGNALNLIGIIVLLCSALSWSIGSLYSHYAKMPDSPVLGTGMEMLAGGVLLLIAGVVSGEWRELDPAQISLSSALALGYLIIFGSFVTFTAFNWLLRTVAPTRVATYAYVNPVVAVFLGWAIAGEPLTLRTLLSTVIIVSAVAIIIAFRARDTTKTDASLMQEEVLAVDDAIGAMHEGTAEHAG